MTSQPLWEQIKSARISRSGLIGLAAGIGLGLALGLLIGWVWWPVEWQGSANSVTVTKAEYLSLVADAYQGAGGAPGAVDQAQARLAQLGPTAAADFVAATEYYAAQAGSSDQVRNLVTLSIALGMPVDIASNPEVAQAMRPADAPALSGASSADGGAAGQSTAQEPTQNSGGGVNGFALILLFALLLIAGGAYLYWTMARRRSTEQADTWGDEPAGAFAEETDYAGSSAGVITAFDRSTLQPAAPQPAPPRPAPASTFSPRSYSTMNTSPPVSGPPGFEPEDDFGAGAKTSAAYFARPVDDYAPDAARVSAALVEEEYDDDGEDDNDDDMDAVAVATTAATVAAPPRPATPSRYERYKTIDTYPAAFHAGMANVDFMRNIKDEEAGRYLGEYGMFVHERNGLLNGNVDQVVAFEVTLVDKADEHPSLTTLSRTLISEYAHDKLYTQFENERQSGGAPIIAQKDTNFQLEGNQLLLDCTVTEVTYTKEGIFRSLTLDMVLKRK